jgi:hypothetical protein
MIRVRTRPEPKDFARRCRDRGRNWLKNHAVYEGHPHDYWSEFEPELRETFNGLCGYCAMTVMKGQVDHFIAVAILKARGEDQLAYEWSNFRYGEGVVNQRKSNHLVLDPFKVKDDWFEILLPSMQLVLTKKVPKTQRKLAEFTIEKLGLRDGEVVVRYRRMWFQLYQNRELLIEGLKKCAPGIARTVERDLAAGIDWRV